jgi:hypothetical protein
MGRSPQHAVPTLSAALAMVRRPIVAVIVDVGTANRRPLIVEAIAHKDLGGDRQ